MKLIKKGKETCPERVKRIEGLQKKDKFVKMIKCHSESSEESILRFTQDDFF